MAGAEAAVTDDTLGGFLALLEVAARLAGRHDGSGGKKGRRSGVRVAAEAAMTISAGVRLPGCCSREELVATVGDAEVAKPRILFKRSLRGT